jgi:hypothetical protein
MKFSVLPSILLNSRECSTPGVNEGVNIPPGGQSSTLVAKFTPRGEVHPWGPWVKLRMALRLLPLNDVDEVVRNVSVSRVPVENKNTCFCWQCCHLGSMLWSLFSAIFTDFLQTNLAFFGNQCCYDFFCLNSSNWTKNRQLFSNLSAKLFQKS